MKKISEIFPRGAFLSCVADQMFIEVPLLSEISPELKNSCLHAFTQIVMFYYNHLYYSLLYSPLV